jgi:hypothetical protein
MNPSPRNPYTPDSVSTYGPGTAEATLRLMATVPAPQGLEDRIQARLAAAPRTARILAWPVALRSDHGWMRAAAAAAIVFVVVGGGWGVYSRVQPGMQSGARVVPIRVNSQASGFSSAGAMRTPQTLNGPVAPASVAVVTPAVGASGKAQAKPALTTAHRGKTLAAGKATAQPAAPQAK